MSEVRPRRPSTGGKAPTKIRVRLAIEEAPSHDGTPCFSIWRYLDRSHLPEKWPPVTPPASQRPRRALQIYDTTPGSDDPDHLKALAETLYGKLDMCNLDEETRIDVWGMPLPLEASDEDRVAKCHAHSKVEIVWRKMDSDGEFRMPPRKFVPQWHRVMLIIDRPMTQWDEDEGGSLSVGWDPRIEYLQEQAGWGNYDVVPERRPISYDRRQLTEELECLVYSLSG
ncbi:hypothetical protein K4K59_007639 [Colletotrichum sp. SAR11_240]|nr:hypothetical protein K4K59_007639 [Colletotrichum sp. SAR11_240]